MERVKVIRKIIQIAIEQAVVEDESGYVYALCDDGSLWCASCEDCAPEWKLIETLPDGCKDPLKA